MESRSFQGLKPRSFELSWKITHRYLPTSFLISKPFPLVLKTGLCRRAKRSILIHRLGGIGMTYQLGSRVSVTLEKFLRLIERSTRERLLTQGTLHESSGRKGQEPVIAKTFTQLPDLYRDTSRFIISRIMAARSFGIADPAFFKNKVLVKAIYNNVAKSAEVGRVDKQSLRYIGHPAVKPVLDNLESPITTSKGFRSIEVRSFLTLPKIIDAREPKQAEMVLSLPSAKNTKLEKQAPIIGQEVSAKTSEPSHLDIDKISDRVYNIIERRIKIERERRGLHV